MQLFFNPDIETELTLEKEEHTHATKVLRKQPGELIWIMDGKGNLFHCELTQIGSKKSQVTIKTKKTFAQRNHLHIAIAPTKNNNRLEFFLEKATEIGIAQITPIICARSERKVVKQERMEKIILSAGKQSKSFHLPIFHPAVSFSTFVKNHTHAQQFIAHCEEGEEKHTLLHQSLNLEETTVILIGPEGDFTPQEIALAHQYGFKNLSLGEKRLRTETAGIVACTHYNCL